MECDAAVSGVLVCVADTNGERAMPSGFIRVKLLQCERGELPAAAQTATETFDPFVAVNVKEAQNTPGK